MVLHRQAAAGSCGCARPLDSPPPKVNWRPFQLNPGLPREGVPRAEYVARKFGARGGAIYDRVAGVGREVGIPFAFDRILRQPNTLAAHSLIDLAAGREIQDAVVEAFFRAYFIDGIDLTARANLISVATGGGLDQAEVGKRLDDATARERVAADDAHVREIGIDGVPYFIFNGRLAVSGAQAPEVLLDAMRQATAGESGDMSVRTLQFHPGGASSDLAARLKHEIQGEVLFDRASRGRYSTDASIYQIEPVGVVVPATEEDALRAMQIAIEAGIPVLPRGGGSSQCGQTVGAALVIDNSKHLNQVIEFDRERATATVQPGIVLDHLNAYLKPHGLWCPVDVSTSAQATIGGMTGNNSCGSRSIRYGNMVHSVLAVDAVLADGAQYRFGPSEDVASGPPGYRALIEKIHAIVGREAEEIAARWPKVLRRVQGYNIDMIQPQAAAQPRAPAGRLGRLARLLASDHGQARADSEAQGAGRLPLPDFLRGDGRDPAHRQARPRRGRAGRQHDDRPRPRHRCVRSDRRTLHPRRARGDPAGRIRRR